MWTSPSGERHYAYGICVACGGRACYPVSPADPLESGNYHCLFCRQRVRMIPSKPSADELVYLEKADRLIGYVPTKITEARLDVRQGRRFAFNERSGRIIRTPRVYGSPKPKKAEPTENQRDET